jgi:hypothetical protein
VKFGDLCWTRRVTGKWWSHWQGKGANPWHGYAAFVTHCCRQTYLAVFQASRSGEACYTMGTGRRLTIKTRHGNDDGRRCSRLQCPGDRPSTRLAMNSRRLLFLRRPICGGTGNAPYTGSQARGERDCPQKSPTQLSTECGASFALSKASTLMSD